MTNTNFGIADALRTLGIRKTNRGTSTGQKWLSSKGADIASYSPVDGRLIGRVRATDDKTFDAVVARAHQAFLQWRMVPAPKRGEVVRQVGMALRKFKEPLGKLVSYEMGKSYAEGLGEVQ
jgi:aldehyde dehydrogenase (NAD+)